MRFRLRFFINSYTAWRGCGAVLALGFLTGCTTPPLQAARNNFHHGRFQQADHDLAVIPENDKDSVLYLMERGMIRQSLQEYDASSTDWRQAADLDTSLETYSVSQGAASLVVNDRALSFRGAPFERTLLFTFLAKNYLAQQNWDYAAICARNIIRQLEDNDGYPDIPYCRYMAGFCLELINDAGNAAIQYKTIAKLLPDCLVDAANGRLHIEGLPDLQPIPAHKEWRNELICFVLIGRIPPGNQSHSAPPAAPPPYAEIYYANHYLGRSYPLANTADLIAATEKREAMIELAKSTTRLALKIGISEAIRQQNEMLGFLSAFLLFAMESPDCRRWETLPLWLEVARVSCPSNLDEVNVVFSTGKTIKIKPAARRANIYIAFCRDNIN